MNAVEAVARALYRRFLVGESGSFSGLNDEVDANWQTWEGEARAALAALRDCGVTEGMVDVANVHGLSSYESVQAMRAAQFRAMLDAALGEG